jgi:hypothetical protein
MIWNNDVWTYGCKSDFLCHFLLHAHESASAIALEIAATDKFSMQPPGLAYLYSENPYFGIVWKA